MKLKEYNVILSSGTYPVIGFMEAFETYYILVTREMYDADIHVSKTKYTVVEKYRHIIFKPKEYTEFYYVKLVKEYKMNDTLKCKFKNFKK